MMAMVFIYGAGMLGRKIVAEVDNVSAFIDDTPEKLGTIIDDVPVISFTQFLRLHADKPHRVYLCICLPDHCVSTIIASLKNQSSKSLNIQPFTDYFLSNPNSAALPHLYWHEQVFQDGFSEQYRTLRADLTDRQSLVSLDNFIEVQTKGVARQSHVDPRSDIPFKNRLNADIHYIDCGAFDGDTIQGFLQLTNKTFRKITAVEPDENNLVRCRQRLSKMSSSVAEKIDVIPAAVSDVSEFARFDSAGGIASSLSMTGDVLVRTISLSELVNESNLFIKLDIEGAEFQALVSALDEIEHYQPLLAISVYHAYNDLIEIYRLLKARLANYRFALRTHGMNGTDTMLYCFPQSDES